MCRCAARRTEAGAASWSWPEPCRATHRRGCAPLNQPGVNYTPGEGERSAEPALSCQFHDLCRIVLFVCACEFPKLWKPRGMVAVEGQGLLRSCWGSGCRAGAGSSEQVRVPADRARALRPPWPCALGGIWSRGSRRNARRRDRATAAMARRVGCVAGACGSFRGTARSARPRPAELVVAWPRSRGQESPGSWGGHGARLWHAWAEAPAR